MFFLMLILYDCLCDQIKTVIIRLFIIEWFENFTINYSPMRQTFIELLSIFLEALYLLLETFFYIVIQFSILVFSCIRTA